MYGSCTIRKTFCHGATMSWSPQEKLSRHGLYHATTNQDKTFFDYLFRSVLKIGDQRLGTITLIFQRRSASCQCKKA